MRDVANPRYYLRIAVMATALLTCCGNAAAQATEEETVQLTEEMLAADPQTTHEKQCTWACLEWTRLCNVDPRGVYKCRRTCANFSEVCE